MQSKSNNEHELVKICMNELCARVGFVAPDKLVQRDLTALCDIIEAKTDVLISLSTMRRLMNGQFSRLPQIATLDAIAKTAGYQNWRDFIQSTPGTPSIPSALSTPGVPFPSKVQSTPDTLSTSGTLSSLEARPSPRARSTRRVRYIAAAALLVLGALAFVMSNKPQEPGNIDKAQFSATKVTGNDIPNTVIFKYNVDSVTADSFFIQQSWDESRRVRVYKHNYTLSDIYYEPGYHTAKLIANNKVIRSVPVSIPIDRWLFFARENVFGSIPKYITTAKPDTGRIKLSVDDLVNSKIDIQKDNNYCEVYSPSKFEYSSDNFTMKCRVRVVPVNNEACPRLMCEIYSQYYFMYFISTLKGCTSRLNAQFGEHDLNGSSNDLSGLGADLREWNDMEFTVRDKKVSILINGKQAFSSAYTQSAGMIAGLGFVSNGLCEVEFVDLTTADGKPIYSRGIKSSD